MFRIWYCVSYRGKSINFAVSKSASKDAYVPLNYRRKRLLSCVSKVFSGFWNKVLNMDESRLTRKNV